MKKALKLGLLLCFVACSVMAERVRIVRVTDMAGNTELQIMNAADYKALQAEIKEEQKVFAKFLQQAKKEWAANEELSKFPFPGNKIKPRSAKQVGMEFANEEKAGQKKDKLDERAAEKLTKETEKEEARMKRLSDEDQEREIAKKDAFNRGVQMVMKLIGDQLGRPVPSIGFALTEAPLKAEKNAKKDEKADKKEKKGKKDKGEKE